jgi:hypothetical protein
MLSVKTYQVGRWTVPAVGFEPEDLRLTFVVNGVVGNSVTTSPSGRKRLTEWKVAVARAAIKARGMSPLDPTWTYTVSAGFSFNVAAHGSQPLDVENFLKPTFDALAAGLFCDSGQDPRAIERFNFDDSGFRYLFVHRLADALDIGQEGVAIVLSIRKGDATSLGF